MLVSLGWWENFIPTDSTLSKELITSDCIPSNLPASSRTLPRHRLAAEKYVGDPLLYLPVRGSDKNFNIRRDGYHFLRRKSWHFFRKPIYLALWIVCPHRYQCKLRRSGRERGETAEDVNKNAPCICISFFLSLAGIDRWRGPRAGSQMQDVGIFSDERAPNQPSQTIVTVDGWTLSLVLGAHILPSWLCYVFAKFACKIHIQNFSYAFPISVAMPLSVTLLLALGGLREIDTCIFHRLVDGYLSFDTPSIYRLGEFVAKEHAWMWILAIIAQAWITKVRSTAADMTNERETDFHGRFQHIWTPKNDRNASTEQLFVQPMYRSLLIDHDLLLNRRRDDRNASLKKIVNYSLAECLQRGNCHLLPVRTFCLRTSARRRATRST